MKRFYSLAILLVFAIAVQNTCPFGLAAKIGFVSPQTHNCPCAKKAEEKIAAGENAKHIVPEFGNVFVFMGQGWTVVLPSQVPQGSCAVYPADFYLNISLNPPEKPPRLS